MDYRIIRLTDQPEMKERAAEWFHEKWGIPQEAYQESMVQGDGEPDMSRMYVHRA